MNGGGSQFSGSGTFVPSVAYVGSPAGAGACCAGAIDLGTVFVGETKTLDFPPPDPCPGCGMNYMTCCAGMAQHNQEACVAFKRGFELGKAEGRAELLRQQAAERAEMENRP